MSDRVRVGVLVSGGGTNLAALLAASEAPNYPAQVAVVLSNRPRAFGLQRARQARVPTEVVLKRDHADRESYDAEVARRLAAHGVEWVALAGFMRLVSPVLLDAFPQRVLNIHPSLLPAFPGLHAQQQALDYGATVSGATVHLVDSGMDTGPVVLQRAVDVLPDDSLDDLKARILAVEHQIYPESLRLAAEGRLELRGRRVRIRRG
jgi:phosphoribosylglycinamide formyltransferase 1